jgi:DNA-binding response OmpR family regulator
MVRPCFFVIDREHSASISTRKLMIETAKFNVLTAYSGQEALDTFALFPAISGVVLDSNLQDVKCSEVLAKLKASAPALPVIVVRGPGREDCRGADHYLDSFQPSRLLDLLLKRQPRAAEAIEKQNEALSREGN